MSIIPTWPIAAGALVIGLAGGFYFEHTRLGAKIDRMTTAHAEELRQREVQRATDERKARDIEQRLLANAGRIEQERQDEIARIRTDNAAAIARLSNRPARVVTVPGTVPSAPAACPGATGAQLYREDAAVALRIAGDADEHRAALQACYKWADTVISAAESGQQPAPAQ